VRVADAGKDTVLAQSGSGRQVKAAVAIGIAVLVSVAVIAGWQNSIWPLNQHSEKALARRAQQYWDLKISGDTLGAYGFMAASYRRRVTPDGFARVGGGLVIHTGAVVKSVHVHDGDATVDLELRYVLNHGRFADTESVVEAKERWVFEDGAWHRWPPDVGPDVG
jgi:hypothetical protein